MLLAVNTYLEALGPTGPASGPGRSLASWPERAGRLVAGWRERGVSCTDFRVDSGLVLLSAA